MIAAYVMLYLKKLTKKFMQQRVNTVAFPSLLLQWNRAFEFDEMRIESHVLICQDEESLLST